MFSDPDGTIGPAMAQLRAYHLLPVADAAILGWVLGNVLLT